MTAPTIPVLGAATVNRKFVYEFNTGTVASPVWTAIGGLINSQFQPDQPNMVGDTDQAGKGFQSSTKTGATWSGTLTVSRKVSGADPTQYDTAQEFMRVKSIGQFGPLNTVQVRVCEYDPNDPTGARTPRIEAYTGYCSASWQPQGGDMLAEDETVIAFEGQGALVPIAHPYPATAALVPVITSATPLALGTAGGQLVTIVGRGFTAVTGAASVKFGGTNATSYVVENDNMIVAISPAHSAGAAIIVVTNPTGPSAVGNPSATYS